LRLDESCCFFRQIVRDACLLNRVDHLRKKGRVVLRCVVLEVHCFQFENMTYASADWAEFASSPSFGVDLVALLARGFVVAWVELHVCFVLQADCAKRYFSLLRRVQLFRR
jgi:hypothetical protein